MGTQCGVTLESAGYPSRDREEADVAIGGVRSLTVAARFWWHASPIHSFRRDQPHWVHRTGVNHRHATVCPGGRARRDRCQRESAPAGVWSCSVGEANSLGHTLAALGAMYACVGMVDDENHNTLLTGMATPEPTRNVSVPACAGTHADRSRRVAMARRTLPQKMATPSKLWLTAAEWEKLGPQAPISD